MSINRKYPIEPIIIEITDNGKFADMAHFFDQPDVIQDIYELRVKWLENKLISHSRVDDFLNEHDDRQHWNNYLEGREIAIKYHVGTTFVRPIVSAVLSGKIDDSDYSTIIEEYPIDHIPVNLEIPEKIALISPRMREYDFKKRKQRKDDKSIASVKNHRKWYWLNHKMGYRKIAKENKQVLNTVISGIESYILALKNYSLVM